MVKEKSFLLSLLIFLSVFSWAIANTGGQVATKVYVHPAIRTANPGETFSVDIKIANVENLYVYEFKLKWEPDLLDVTSVTEGPFLNAERHYKTFFVKKIWNAPDPMGVSGYIYVACTLMGEPRTAAASGSGILATVEFLVEKEGNSTLHVYDPLLEDYDKRQTVPTTEDGYFLYPPPTQIRFEPPSLIDPSLVPGSTFNFNASIVQAVEAYSWSLNIKWKSTLLNVTGVEEGPFLNQEGAYNTTFNYQIHQEEGYLYANCSLTDPDVWASGNGTLIVITFLAEAEGNSILELYDTLLLNYKQEKILHTTRNGYFVNVLRDVSILSVLVSPDSVKAGDSVSIFVVAKNEGETPFGQSIDVNIYYNESFLGTLGIPDLSPGYEKSLSLSWSTEGLSEGKYRIKAEASPVTGEIDTTNNAYVYEYLLVMPPDQSFPFMLIIALLVVAIFVVFTGFFLLKRRS